MTKQNIGELSSGLVTQVISLGPRCATAYNIRRYFNIRSAFPFDWWVTPEPGLIGVLRNPDVNFLYDPGELSLTESSTSVRHKTLGIIFHHEFPRDWGHASQPVRADFRDHVETPRERTRYLLNKLYALNRSDQRIVFIVERHTSPLLFDVLSAIFDRALWALASIDSIVDDSAFGWKQNPAMWDGELAKLGVNLDRAGHNPFVDRGAAHTDEDVGESALPHPDRAAAQ
jgi:hypothetical protein